MRWVRAFVCGGFATIGLTAANVSSGTTLELTQYHIFIQQFERPGFRRLGDGFIRWDQAVVDRQIDEWVTARLFCDQPGDQEGCENVPETLEVMFPLIAAQFGMFGHVFRDEQIVWQERYALEGEHADLIGMFVTMDRVGDFVHFGAGGDDLSLSYLVNGNSADCDGSFCEVTDPHGNVDNAFLFFDWIEEPVSAPEPGTLGLLGLGLLGLGATRRNRRT